MTVCNSAFTLKFHRSCGVHIVEEYLGMEDVDIYKYVSRIFSYLRGNKEPIKKNHDYQILYWECAFFLSIYIDIEFEWTDTKVSEKMVWIEFFADLEYKSCISDVTKFAQEELEPFLAFRQAIWDYKLMNVLTPNFKYIQFKKIPKRK